MARLDFPGGKFGFSHDVPFGLGGGGGQLLTKKKLRTRLPAAGPIQSAFKPPADLELERIRISAGYTLFVFGIHTGCTLYNPGIHM